MKLLYTISIIALLTACSSNSKVSDKTEPELRGPELKDTYTYLALGDSYTIGESVEPEGRWPAQLANNLNEKGLNIRGPIIIAKTGWRTDDMLNAAKAELSEDEKYDIVTLLIGVNNEYQGWEPAKFQPEFEKCLDYAVSKCTLGKKGVFVVSIPDYGYTPFGENNKESISKRLDQYNAICKAVCKTEGVTFYDITGISRTDKNGVNMVAEDGLHPSGEQYKLWVDSFADKMQAQLTN